MLLHLRMVLVHTFEALLWLIFMDRVVVVGVRFHRSIHLCRIHGFLHGVRSTGGIQV